LWLSNTYITVENVTYLYNHMGPPLGDGENIKDRSCGLVVAYNFIEGGEYLIDMVDGHWTDKPNYFSTHVYGNLMVKIRDSPNYAVTHYGGDLGNTSIYRNGSLYFYHNTVVSYHFPKATALFFLSTDASHVDARNNVFWSNHTANFLLDSAAGSAFLDGNFMQDSWQVCPATHGQKCSVARLEEIVNGTSPGFVAEPSQLRPDGGVPYADYHLSPTSVCRNKAVALAPEAHPVTRQYGKGGLPRASARDLGAFDSA